jgi:hypothetical protein
MASLGVDHREPGHEPFIFWEIHKIVNSNLEPVEIATGTLGYVKVCKSALHNPRLVYIDAPQTTQIRRVLLEFGRVRYFARICIIYTATLYRKKLVSSTSTF